MALGCSTGSKKGGFLYSLIFKKQSGFLVERKTQKLMPEVSFFSLFFLSGFSLTDTDDSQDNR